ncbi:tryptophan 2,3-dioxygenase [Actinopolyspora mortivallis]|uniref:tryptophan 2,3-dioxygenase n=1 Tax=Actinopolyspora mortivallis TaxID=33906 RepID=UPI0003653DA1|nr:tryptophan 2,3-dioxygenase family protein [Actinopolyspora mortivallis]
MFLERNPQEEFTEVRRWFEEYLEEHDERLGRSGAVCPFVQPALRNDCVRFELAEADDPVELAELTSVMEGQIERFEKVDWPEGKVDISALVTVLRGVSEERAVLLDDAQRAVKGTAVRNGLMIGQFHPRCPDPSARNPEFAVSRAPEPLFVIRRMAFHDILFLHDVPELFAEYDRRFGHYYHERAAGKVDPRFAELYRLARGEGTKSPYIDYEHIDTLLSLQTPRTGKPAETTFYVLGQVKELLFKLIYEETRSARLRLVERRLDDAIVHLRRIVEEFGVLRGAWDVLDTLSPGDFAEFRDQLGIASGMDSYMFRMMEFALGKKSEAMAERHRGVPGAEEQVYRALRESSLYDEAVRVVSERFAPSAEGGRTEPEESAGERNLVDLWAEVYRSTARADESFRLAEALVGVAEEYARWCCSHLLTVERLIGTKPGTGGTEGVSWLRASADYRLFPELWRARTVL